MTGKIGLRLRLIDALREVDLDDPESLCNAHKAIWNAEIDMMAFYNRSPFDNDEGDREDMGAFDHYDILDPTLAQDFQRKVGALIIWCVQNGVAII